MPGRRRYRECKVCGARWPFVTISSRGLCSDHGKRRMIENVTQLREHDGPNFRRWRAAMAAAVGGRLDERSDES